MCISVRNESEKGIGLNAHKSEIYRKIKENPTFVRFSILRRGWDSNPCALSDKRFSRPPRYDHFATSPRRRKLGILASVCIFVCIFDLCTRAKMRSKTSKKVPGLSRWHKAGVRRPTAPGIHMTTILRPMADRPSRPISPIGNQEEQNDQQNEARHTDLPLISVFRVLKWTGWRYWISLPYSFLYSDLTSSSAAGFGTWYMTFPAML